MEWWHNQFPSPLEPVMITATRACYNVQNKIKLYKFNFFLSESLWNTTYTYCFQFYFQENKKMVFLMCEVLHPLQLNDTIVVWDRLFVIYPFTFYNTFLYMCLLEAPTCTKHIHVTYNGKSGISGVGPINKYPTAATKFPILIMVLT